MGGKNKKIKTQRGHDQFKRTIPSVTELIGKE
jgi:hypothetical protein